MPLAVNERVELPKGIVRARKGDNIYIQYIVRVYRNEKGKPTNDRVQDCSTLLQGYKKTSSLPSICP